MPEKSLHAALKHWYAEPGDEIEQRVEGYIVDIVRGELLIEIQTRSFSAIRRKLATLAEHHPVRLVYPIVQDKWIVRMSADGKTRIGRRKSPRRGRIEDVFEELVSVPGLLALPNFTLELLLVQAEEIRRDDGRGSWRRKGWSVHDHRLLEVLERRLFLTPADFRALLPAGLPAPFTTGDLAAAVNCSRDLAQKMAYCLRAMGTIEVAGKRRAAWLYLVRR
jgi:hypothetical protein